MESARNRKEAIEEAIAAWECAEAAAESAHCELWNIFVESDWNPAWYEFAMFGDFTATHDVAAVLRVYIQRTKCAVWDALLQLVENNLDGLDITYNEAMVELHEEEKRAWYFYSLLKTILNTLENEAEQFAQWFEEAMV